MMNTWEDKIKEKLSGYESPLPEGVIILPETEDIVSGKRNNANLWIAIAALAACLAVIVSLPFLFRRADDVMQSDHLPVSELMEPKAFVDDDSLCVIQYAGRIKETPENPVVKEEKLEEDRTIQESESEPESEPEQFAESPIETPPIIPQSDITQSGSAVENGVGDKGVGIMAGGILGTGIMGALASSFPGSTQPPVYGGGYGALWHGLPLQVGVSARIPVWGRLSVTTGMQYSLYLSKFSSLSGNEMQYAHYLGIPLRVDWMLASGKILDVYVGAGLEGDICIAATKKKIGGVPKGGPSLSLLSAFGVQVNLTKKIGVFIEPELTWTFLSEKNSFETYRTTHPVMISFASGLRFTLGQ